MVDVIVEPPQVLALLVESIDPVGDDGCAFGNKRSVGDVTVGSRGWEAFASRRPDLTARVLVNVGDG